MRLRFWILLILAAVAAAALALAPRSIPKRVRAYTHCVAGEPVAVVRPGLSPADSAQAAFHEETHVLQARLMGCAAWQTWARTPAGTLEIEAEAYCADLLTVAATKAEVRRGAHRIADLLLSAPAYRNVRSLGRDSVAAAVARHCGT